LQTLGQATLVHWLCAGSVCRWLARLRFPVDRWHEYACRRLLQAGWRYDPHGDRIVIFDGTVTKRWAWPRSRSPVVPARSSRAKKAAGPVPGPIHSCWGWCCCPRGPQPGCDGRRRSCCRWRTLMWCSRCRQRWPRWSGRTAGAATPGYSVPRRRRCRK
jgi:hypothetical protein